jgi:hypothetical protein
VSARKLSDFFATLHFELRTGGHGKLSHTLALDLLAAAKHDLAEIGSRRRDAHEKLDCVFGCRANFRLWQPKEFERRGRWELFQRGVERVRS